MLLFRTEKCLKCFKPQEFKSSCLDLYLLGFLSKSSRFGQKPEEHRGDGEEDDRGLGPEFIEPEY